MGTEILATSNLQRLIERSNLLISDIRNNDRTPFLDGYIRVYRTRGNNHPNDDLRYQIPIQVKGQIRSRPSNSFDIEKTALKYYKVLHGTLFFKICLDKSGENETFYYKALLPGDIDQLLDNSRGNSYVRMRLDPFPTDTQGIEAIIIAFANAMREDTPDNDKFWANYFPDTHAPQPDPAPNPAKPRNPYLYNSGIVNFYGRENEIKRLHRFLADERPFCWWSIIGEGGVGKSRLAYELQQNLLNEGTWTVENLSAVGLHDLPMMSQDSFNQRYPAPTLLIVDYAQQYAAALSEWMGRLAAADSRREPDSPLRMLLLDRSINGPNGESSLENELLLLPDGGHLLQARYGAAMVLETPARKALQEIMLDFADYLRREDPNLPSMDEKYADQLLTQLEKMPKNSGRPLFAMLLTDASLHRARQINWSWESLLDYYIKRERVLLNRRLGDLGAPNQVLRDAVLELCCVATVLGTDGDPEWTKLAELCPDYAKHVRSAAEAANIYDDILLQRLNLMDGNNRYFIAMRPDLFGEYMVLDWLRDPSRRQGERSRFFAAILSDRKAAGTFFLRILRDFGDLIQTSDGYVDWLFPTGLQLTNSQKAALIHIMWLIFSGEQFDASIIHTEDSKAFVGAISKEARTWLVSRMEVYVNTLQGDDLDSAYAFHDFADVIRRTDRIKDAERYSLDSLRIKEKNLGKDSISTADTYNLLANVYRDLGKYLDAIQYFREALIIKESVLGVEHPDVADIYSSLATAFYYSGDSDSAKEYFKKALLIQENALGTKHLSTASTYNNLALLHRSERDYPNALEYNKKSLAIQEAELGENHPDIATTYNNLAIVYQEQKEYPLAFQYHEKALKIREKVHGPEHPHTAQSYHNIAFLYKSLGKYPEALEYNKKALKIREKVFGEEHPDTAISYNNIGCLYLAWQKPDEAIPWLRRSLEIRKATLGLEHFYTKSTQKTLDSALSQQSQDTSTTPPTGGNNK